MIPTVATIKDSPILFLGDFISFTAALWFSLAIRHFQVPTGGFFLEHFLPFLPLFIIWALVFFILDLYNKNSLLLGSNLPSVIFRAQLVNSLVALVFFYLLPFTGITPRTILVLDLVCSFALVLAWRFYANKSIHTGEKERMLIVGGGEDVLILKKRLITNEGYNFIVVNHDVEVSADARDIEWRIKKNNVSVIALDLNDPKMTTVSGDLYQNLFTRVHFVDLGSLYEEVFDRVPLSLVNDRWFLENITYHRKQTYTVLKRIMDVILAIVIGFFSLLFYPFVILGLKLEDGGDIFIRQKRIGQMNTHITLIKFRTMRFDDGGDPELIKQNYVTRLGAFLRKTRIDELPQLWNVLRGDISLVGPRPEFLEYVREYREEIPYYDVRHTIKPGLSGWAQIYQDNHPHHGTDKDATQEKFSYDLFYVKNRSFLLDLTIVLKTIRTFLSRKGI